MDGQKIFTCTQFIAVSGDIKIRVCSVAGIGPTLGGNCIPFDYFRSVKSCHFLPIEIGDKTIITPHTKQQAASCPLGKILNVKAVTQVGA